jgi:hypothetical protein
MDERESRWRVGDDDEGRGATEVVEVVSLSRRHNGRGRNAERRAGPIRVRGQFDASYSLCANGHRTANNPARRSGCLSAHHPGVP